ncbi:MAG: MoxR family ATPase [Clostridiales bacterium]|mgnify:CR=1 FL=1|uniref:AAA family ATPase n=1 Tax=Clostridium sp. N3C TaxID=1776758 RepID=UPI00092E0215|nr:MoxR family ATPase [Clostridium sp. N3C]NLZ49937.1 MoxR family ATPase [Clostridiales bacterium]SCN22591.1 magnesium chelatase ATPase subunit D [Clostridium sp. N3C]
MKDTNVIIQEILSNVEKVIIGKRDSILDIMKGIIAGGHILIEDVPGVGKTTLVKALAKSLNLSYSRIQFTPDLLPSDITGISIFNQKEMQFEFRKGPIFANIVLADEINRTAPKTQSALLEVMEENQVSESVHTYKLEQPFFVLATQNPIEYEGTYTLPEAQLDRFMIKVTIGYPDKDSEAQILDLYKNRKPLEELEAVAGAEDIIALQKACREVMVAQEINRYIANLAEATRTSKLLNLGMSTRAALALQKIAQASALINGRNYVVPDDVKDNVALVLAHRLTLSSEARANNFNSEQVIANLLQHVHAPKVN